MSPTKQALLNAIETAPDPIIEELLNLLQQRLSKPATASPEQSERPLWAIAADITNSIPPEAWATIPSDLSTNFDQYQKRHHQP